jgi:hypothetical protein
LWAVDIDNGFVEKVRAPFAGSAAIIDGAAA